MANPNVPRNQVWLVSDSGPAYFMDLHMTVDENHDMSAEVTEHNVERGANITDHIRWRADRVSLRVYVSNSPLSDDRVVRQGFVLNTQPNGPPPGTTVPSIGVLNQAVKALVSDLLGREPTQFVAQLDVFPDETEDDVRTFLERVDDLRARNDLLQIYTPKRTYENMVLESVSMTRGRDDGDGATLALGFKRVRIVATQRVAAPAPTQERAAAPANKGTQSKTPQEVRKSLFVRSGTKGVARPLR